MAGGGSTSPWRPWRWWPPSPVAPTGWVYPAVAATTGTVFIVEAVRLWRRAHAGAEGAQLKAMRLFHWSNSYLALLFLAIAIDPLIG